MVEKSRTSTEPGHGPRIPLDYGRTLRVQDFSTSFDILMSRPIIHK